MSKVPHERNRNGTEKHTALVIAAIMIKLDLRYLKLQFEDLHAASNARVACVEDSRDRSWSIHVTPEHKTVEGDAAMIDDEPRKLSPRERAAQIISCHPLDCKCAICAAYVNAVGPSAGLDAAARELQRQESAPFTLHTAESGARDLETKK